jgi:hypothetical protein
VTADPFPADPPPPERTGTSRCPLCGRSVQASDVRCPECNMTLAGTGGRPGPFSSRALWLWAGALLLIYLVALAVVALVPD